MEEVFGRPHIPSLITLRRRLVGAPARVADALPEDADVIVVSPLGMGENTSRADFLGKMLDAAIEGEIVIDVEATACALLGGDLTGLSGTPLLEP